MRTIVPTELAIALCALVTAAAAGSACTDRPVSTGAHAAAGAGIGAPPAPAGPRLVPTVAPRAAPPARVVGVRSVRPGGSVPSGAQAARMYPWPRRAARYHALARRFAPPPGFTRAPVAPRSYAYWLRHLPLRRPGTPVLDYRGRRVPDSTAAAAAVIDLDVGRRDLQQCMDVLMRLRGEYLWWRGSPDRTAFRYAGGIYVGWRAWRTGLRPRRRGRRFVMVPARPPASSLRAFRSYLTFMFAMTGTMHNTEEPAVSLARVHAGAFFVQPPPRPGYLGHAVGIFDVARGPGGQVAVILGEGYTPAQDLHILRAPAGGVWYRLRPGAAVRTPVWPTPFRLGELRRFRH